MNGSGPELLHRPRYQATTIQIRTMRCDQVPDVAAIHLAAFETFFLSSLGPRFLRTLYRGIAHDPTGFVLTASGSDGRLLGFAAGVREQGGFFSRLLRRQILQFGWAALPALICRPLIAPRLWRALRRPSQVAAADALLMSIAVDPRFSGQGIGGRLLESFLDRMEENGVQAVSLTTDREDNGAANAFYRRHGFELTRSFATPEGRQMNEYVIGLPRQSQRQAA